jgi:hypothetical protein
VSAWDVSYATLKCSSLDCTTTIGAGESFRRVGVATICAPCAKTRFDMDPPAAMPATNSAQSFRERLSGFVPVSAAVEDFRQRQLTPEREPGEEG